nr:hypothetical protein [Candidatus Frankia nodulisporulans]
MPIIALVGVDGAGKTTQARRLAAALSTAGRPRPLPRERRRTATAGPAHSPPRPPRRPGPARRARSPRRRGDDPRHGDHDRARPVMAARRGRRHGPLQLLPVRHHAPARTSRRRGRRGAG